MSGPRPYVPRLVALLPPEEAGRAVEWARSMLDAGLDGLALRGDPADPAALHLAAALRAAVPLPLELHGPLGRGAGGPADRMAEAGLDWLVPEGGIPEGAARDLAGRGVGVAWPVAEAPPQAARVHAQGVSGADPFPFEGREPGAERSLTLNPEQDRRPPGIDTWVVPGEALGRTDPGAAVRRWRAGAG